MAINWEAVTGVTQILTTISTFVAIIVSLRIAKYPIISKGKIIIGRSGRFSDTNSFVFLNTGHSKVIIKAHGLFVSKSILPNTKNSFVVVTYGEKIELNPAEEYVFKITDNEINERLVSLHDCKREDKVWLTVFFLDSKNKRFEKTIRYKIK